MALGDFTPAVPNNEAFHRDRNLLPTLPFVPKREAVQHLSGYNAAEVRAIMERGNDTTERLRALSCGEVIPVSGKASPPWDESPAPQRELALSTLERWRSWHTEIEAAPSPSEALDLLRREPKSGRLRRA